MRPRMLEPVAVTLGYALVALGGGKLAGVEGAVAPLRTLGLPGDVAFWVGWGEVALGLLLTIPPLHRAGGVALALWTGAAVVAHLRVGEGPRAALPLALVVLGLLLARTAAPLRGQGSRLLPAPLLTLPSRPAPAVGFVLRSALVAFLIRWAVGGILFWAALPLLGLAHAARRGGGGRRERLEAVLLYLLFYGYGVGGLWNFVGHVFMADTVAASVGWAPGSPFQTELGFYALGTGLVGLITPWWRDRYWVAAALAPSVFVWGAAFVHVRDYLVHGNDAPMNWGPAAVGANVVIPAAVLWATWAYARAGGFREAGSPGSG